LKRKGLGSKAGFGIVEVLISILVLGLMAAALNNLQLGNHKTFLRIRGRDGATEVAQHVLDSLKTIGVAAIASSNEGNTVTQLGTVERTWDRGLGGKVSVVYTPTVTVAATSADYIATNKSKYEDVQHVFAKQVNVKVSWNFAGSTQSIDVSGVVR